MSIFIFLTLKELKGERNRFFSFNKNHCIRINIVPYICFLFKIKYDFRKCFSSSIVWKNPSKYISIDQRYFCCIFEMYMTSVCDRKNSTEVRLIYVEQIKCLYKISSFYGKRINTAEFSKMIAHDFYEFYNHNEFKRILFRLPIMQVKSLYPKV